MVHIDRANPKQQVDNQNKLRKPKLQQGKMQRLAYSRAITMGAHGYSKCDVFINHRGVDTKHNIASLIYDRLLRQNLTPFLDNKSMEPGDKLLHNISSAIQSCKVGVAVFSPRYLESEFCLHELALLVESRKKVIPIFYDIKPSELLTGVAQYSLFCSPRENYRIRRALEEARYTVGLTFDSQSGNWSEFVASAAEIIVKAVNMEKKRKSSKNYSFLGRMIGN